MAKIELSDLAPSGASVFSLANATFEAPHETDDPVVLANAESHPWLKVTYPEPVEAGYEAPRSHVAPEDDVLSAQNSVANDPDAVQEALPQRRESAPLAVDAGLDQNEAETTDSGVAVTLAADDTDSSGSKPRRSSRKEK